MSHADLLRLLLPSPYDGASALLAAELRAEGTALDRAQGAAEQLLDEADPRTCSALLPDWERVYDLPDPCIKAAGIEQSFAARRAALVSLVTMDGGQSREFFIALAAALGYAITITEGRPQTTEDDTETAVMDEQYRFIWTANAPAVTVRELTTEDDTEMATAVWGNELLECRIRRFKPAHTYVLFAYH